MDDVHYGIIPPRKHFSATRQRSKQRRTEADLLLQCSNSTGTHWSDVTALSSLCDPHTWNVI